MFIAKQLLGAVLASLAAVFVLGQGEQSSWPLHNNGLNKVIEWDHYSFLVNGQRMFLFSGEQSFNTFSIYNHWGFHNPAPGVLDFETGSHNFTSIMTLAKELGLFMIVRPGPYVNAEVNAGGYPLWLTTGEYGDLRTDDPKYTAAWMPYWKKVSEIVRPHLITNGGNVIMYQIENELGNQWTDIASKALNVPAANYMQLLEDSARASGIDVPLSHNSPNMNGYAWSKDFSSSTGNVDVVGLDSYPSCWSCNLSECTGTNGEYVAYKTQEYYTYFTKQSPTQPNFMPEYQGGSYNPWGGPEGGCPNDIGADFANLFYRNLISQRVTAISLYMIFGGTNWGWLAAPVVASSYDYSSPVAESRSIGAKYYETKLLALFTRAAKDLAKTERIGNHAYSPSSTVERFTLNVNTSDGPLTIPMHNVSDRKVPAGNIISGHRSKIIVTDFKFGNFTLVYSTAEILTYAVIGDRPVLILYVPLGESGEFRVRGSANRPSIFDVEETSPDSSTYAAYLSSDKRTTTISFTPVRPDGMELVRFREGPQIILTDRDTALRFWQPMLANDPLGNQSVIIRGPSLVRSARINATAKRLDVFGDADRAYQFWAILPREITSVLGFFVSHGQVGDNRLSYNLTALGPWKYDDSLPEIGLDYTTSNETWIDIQLCPPDTHNPVLYVDEYSIHVGNHIFRATFPSTTTPPTSLFLNITGGNAFGYSAYVNSKYIGSYLGLSYSGAGVIELSLANATLTPATSGVDNTLVVIMDNSGHDLREAAVAPRGITNVTLLGPSDRSEGGKGYSFTSWKIAGTAGSATGKIVDPLRGVLNEGGLYAERVGMHLPGYPDSKWPVLSPAAGGKTTTLSVPGAGIRVFRTTVPLKVPSDIDVSIVFKLTAPGYASYGEPSNKGYSNRLRALLFVNGYQYGRFNPYIGNQVRFPVPPGVLDYDGKNTIAVTVWSQSAEGVEVKVEWGVEYVRKTAVDFGKMGKGLRAGWDEEREIYA
ncbi:beta-galactosidase [Bombardia bombarda]|uniref:beta-galactosidase n=1 Tax=Bombardia bombarda TaxID=252184 RepID=A0AA39X8M8_9PEZI|nr:beta-galactosidase [Bombardia bombarda]